jgi:hypothetical protein
VDHTTTPHHTPRQKITVSTSALLAVIRAVKLEGVRSAIIDAEIRIARCIQSRSRHYLPVLETKLSRLEGELSYWETTPDSLLLEAME